MKRAASLRSPPPKTALQGASFSRFLPTPPGFNFCTYGGMLWVVSERFSERARQVVVLAQEEARALEHNHIGTEHILLGLAREEEGLAARVLRLFDVTIERLRAEVDGVSPRTISPRRDRSRSTHEARLALELALREAQSLGHSYIGTEHILLGLVRENEGVAVPHLARLRRRREQDP